MAIHQRDSEYVAYRHQAPQPIRLLMAGHRYEALWREPMVVVRSHLLLTYVYDGQGCVNDQQTHDVQAGDWYVLFPDEVLSVSTHRRHSMCYYWLGLEGEGALSILQQAGITPQSRICSARAKAQTCRLFDKLIEHMAGNTLADTLRANRCLWQLLDVLTSSKSSQATHTLPPVQQGLVQRACQIMQHQYPMGITATEVAGAVGVDRSYLSSLFAQTMGMSMRDFLHQLRINRAQLLLRHTDLAVRQVAGAVGYREYRSFIRCFANQTGRTPGQVAREARKDLDPSGSMDG